VKATIEQAANMPKFFELYKDEPAEDYTPLYKELLEMLIVKDKYDTSGSTGIDLLDQATATMFYSWLTKYNDVKTWDDTTFGKAVAANDESGRVRLGAWFTAAVDSNMGIALCERARASAEPVLVSAKKVAAEIFKGSTKVDLDDIGEMERLLTFTIDGDLPFAFATLRNLADQHLISSELQFINFYGRAFLAVAKVRLFFLKSPNRKLRKVTDELARMSFPPGRLCGNCINSIENLAM
jgi:hypothetical protein